MKFDDVKNTTFRNYNVSLTDEDVDAIIIGELKLAYNQLLEDSDEAEPDWDTLDALEAVLEYWMTPQQYTEWLKEISEQSQDQDFKELDVHEDTTLVPSQAIAHQNDHQKQLKKVSSKPLNNPVLKTGELLKPEAVKKITRLQDLEQETTEDGEHDFFDAGDENNEIPIMEELENLARELNMDINQLVKNRSRENKGE
jgi:hypothetical protein